MATLDQILHSRDRWLDAVRTGEGVSEQAMETLAGCRTALLQLERGLQELGYPVQGFIRPCPVDVESRIRRVEAKTRIPVPEVVSAFWMLLGGVSLVDLKRYRHVAFWEGRGIEGARQFCDGFHVDPCDSDWEEYTLQTFEAFRDDDALDEFRYELAPDGYHKDDISGGPPYGVGRQHAWAPAWENFDWSGFRRPQSAPPDPPDFLSYVRTAILECAGFPGLFGHPEFEPQRRSLVEKLKPF